MKYLNDQITNVTRNALLSLLLLTAPVATLAAEEDAGTMGRAVQADTEVVISAIDPNTRELALSIDPGLMFTVVAPEGVIDLEDIKVGDRVVISYTAAAEVEFRALTEQEQAEPWKVLESGAVTRDGDEVSIENAELVQAVVEVVAMDKDQGAIGVKDSRGLVHFIGDVEPEKFKDLKAGQKVVIVFEESMVLTLEKKY